MSKTRLGAVGYLNARPLVHGLERYEDLFEVRYDVPSTCAALLHAGDVDLGMIPSIEYLRGPDRYRIVPDLAITSDGPVASVALFTRVPVAQIRRIGLDTSSRTSAGLTRILCREAWSIDPSFELLSSEAAVRAEGCDAALVIGDPALFLDEVAAGLAKIDLGAEWTRTQGLPFVWAFWAGRSGAAGVPEVRALQAARDLGVSESDAIADAYCGARNALCRAYLRDNIKYRLGPRELAGLRRYYQLAAAHQLVEAEKDVALYDS